MENKGRLWWFAFHLKQFFYQLLRVDVLRQLIAILRYCFYALLLRRLKTLEPKTGDVGVNTVYMNLQGLRNFAWMGVNRSSLLAYPLAAIRASKGAPVLSIGPRSEGELLNLMGLGFRNVHGLDLMSYSPWIDLGDMHEMPYKDDQFGAVMAGWVIAYSDNRTKAAKEIVRVTKNGGLIAIGVEYTVQSAEELTKERGFEFCDVERLESVRAILDLFGENVDHVYFSQDLPKNPPHKWQLLVIFSMKKYDVMVNVANHTPPSISAQIP